MHHCYTLEMCDLCIKWSLSVLKSSLRARYQNFACSPLQLPRKHHTGFRGGTKDDDHRHEQCIWSWLWYPFELPDKFNPITQMISYCCNRFRSLNCQLTVSQALKIGDNNVIESKGGMCASLFGSDCVFICERCTSAETDAAFRWTKSLNRYDIFCCLADVGRNVILTSGCIIGAFCQVNTCEVIPENTVIYGSGCMRRVQTERPQVWIHTFGL